MNRRQFLTNTSLGSAALMLATAPAYANMEDRPIKVGMIGLDTSHSIAFTKIINSAEYPGIQVTHAYPYGSREIESSYSRIPRYTEEIKKLGVSIMDTIPQLLKEIDVVLLETNDGRLHLEQAKAVFEAGKPVFIDKPIAASLKDALQIFTLAEKHKIPMFSASALRFSPSTVAVAKENKIGKVLGAETYSPAIIETTHPDLFWYGIHGIEALLTLMGPDCQSVKRIHKPDVDIVIGEWKDGRIGTFRGLRAGKTDYGGTAFGTDGIVPAGLYEGYEHLVKEIIQFFKTGIAPVSPEETLAVFAFMEAAEESKRQGGKVVKLETVMEKF